MGTLLTILAVCAIFSTPFFAPSFGGRLLVLIACIPLFHVGLSGNLSERSRGMTLGIAAVISSGLTCLVYLGHLLLVALGGADWMRAFR
jgi:hypothetical protein